MSLDQESFSANPIASEFRAGPSLHVWIKRLFHCNPFYPVSALLLLYSIYAISTGPQFLRTETLQIIFNFSALQIYSVMLVFTAILLAQKRLWYDATLLVVLENILVWVPFMLVSHATFTDGGLARNLCWFGAALAILRMSSFKTLFRGIILPPFLLLSGLLILGLNVFLPLAFRAGLDFAEGVWTDNELWRARSQLCWYIVLPLLVLLGFTLPRAGITEPIRQPHEKRWLPVLLFSLWVIASSVHLYSIGYVDDQKFTPSYFVPLLWAMSWLFALRVLPFIGALRKIQVKCLAIPAGVPVLAAWVNPPEIALTLFLLNFAFFGVLAWRGFHRNILLSLSAASAMGGLLAIPDEWMASVIQGYSRIYALLGLIALAGLIQSVRIHTARGAILGSISLLTLTSAFTQAFSFHIALQAAILYSLSHSLFWKVPLENGSNVFKGLLVGGWLAHSILLQFQFHTPLLTYIPLLTGLGLMIVLVAARILAQRSSGVLAAAGAAVLLVKPFYLATLSLAHAPAGLLPLVGSFLLFGIGTLFALRRRHYA